MSVKVQFSNPDDILSGLGLEVGGDAHRYFMNRAAARMTPYVPYRDKGSVRDALMQGIDYKHGQFVLKGPQQAYLYYGKVMAGKPKEPTDKDLRYTTSPNAKAGPLYDKRMMQAEGKMLAREITDYLRRK